MYIQLLNFISNCVCLHISKLKLYGERFKTQTSNANLTLSCSYAEMSMQTE